MRKDRIRYEEYEGDEEKDVEETTEYTERPRRKFFRKRFNGRRRFRKPFRVEVLLCEDATMEQMPEKKTSGSAGYDLKSMETVTIKPGETYHKLRTGVKMKIPFGSVGSLSMRSSTGDNGLILVNAPGRIDSDYRGEITGTVFNYSKEDITIEAGERIFQIVFEPIRVGDVVNVPEFSPDRFNNTRGEGGYGSTNANKPEENSEVTTE